jgi:type IV pilus assembly protein PilM
MLDRLKSWIRDPPPAMAFEISEAGIAAARIGSRAELDFAPLPAGTLALSPLNDNVIEPGRFAAAVNSLAGRGSGRKRRDVALILPDFSTRIAVLDFDSFPAKAEEQAALVRFRMKRSVPFDVEAAAVSYWAQHASGHAKGAKKLDVVVVVAPLEIIAPFEAPFRAAGLLPGLVTPSAIAALELAPEAGLSVTAKLSGRFLTVLVRDRGILKLVRCLEVPSQSLEDIAAVLLPTIVYTEDNLGGRAEKLLLCGLGPNSGEAARILGEQAGVETEVLGSPLGAPTETNAGLLGYLRSIARNN